MADITLRAAWRKNDATLELDALKFWESQSSLLPKGVDPATRARELCAVAYRDDEVVGVSTATIEFVPQFRSNMAVYRCSASKNIASIPPLSWRITDYSREVLEKWSLENPDKKVLGLMAVMENKAFIQQYSRIMAPAKMVFCGFTPRGLPIRVAWFKHARIPTEWPPRPLQQQAPAPQRRQPAGASFTVNLDRFNKPPKN